AEDGGATRQVEIIEVRRVHGVYGEAELPVARLDVASQVPPGAQSPFSRPQGPELAIPCAVLGQVPAEGRLGDIRPLPKGHGPLGVKTQVRPELEAPPQVEDPPPVRARRK